MCLLAEQAASSAAVHRFATDPLGSPPKRMSGDMNTGCGNVILMCAMMHSYCSRFSKYRLANNGDDCVLFIERKELRKCRQLNEWFLDFGFQLIIDKPVYKIEQVVFCQANPIYDGKTWTMVRHYPETVSKDAVSIKPLNSESVFRKWAAAVGQCGLSLTGGLPIYQDIFNRLIQLSCGSRPLTGDPTLETGWFRLADRMSRRYGAASTEARVSFWRAFGVEPDKQMVIESVIRQSAVDLSHNAVILEPDWLPS
jgi:hypothetical protein